MVELNPRRFAASLCLAVLSCFVVACAAPQTDYAVKPEQARAALEYTTIPAAALGGGVHTTSGRIVGNDVLWYAETDGGVRVLQLWARLTPSEIGTHVAVELQADGGKLSGGIAKNLAKRPAVAGMFRALVREQVDAALTGREFAVANVNGEIGMALAGSEPELEAGLRAGIEADRRERLSTIDKAYNAAN